MSEQLWREATDAERKNHPDVEMLAVLPVEGFQKHEVCICLMSEGFEPQPPQRIHNNWCTYVEQTNDA